METKIPNQDDKKKKTNYLNFILSFLTISAPAAYLIGIYFYKGQLAGFGIDVDAFPITTATAYVHFYTAASLLFTDFVELITKSIEFIEKLGLLKIALGLIIAPCAIYLMLKIKKNSNSISGIKAWNWFSKIISYLHWKNNDFTKALGITGLATYGIFAFAYLTFAAVLMWLLLPTYAYKKGMSFSTERIKEYSLNGCFTEKDKNWMNCVCVIDENGKDTGALLFAIDSTNIGIFNDTGAHIIRINKKMEITRSYKPLQKQEITCGSLNTHKANKQ